MEAYRVACSEFLFCTDDGARALSLIQSAFTADDGLALRSSAMGFAPDLRDGVPVVGHGFGG